MSDNTDPDANEPLVDRSDPDESSAQSTEDDPIQSDDRPASIHRKLGETGVRLNEAHAHLAALRTANESDSAAGLEVRRAEIEALVEALTSARDRLETAIEYSATEAASLDVEVEIDDSTNDKAEGVIPEGDQEDEIPELLWNTSPNWVVELHSDVE